MGWDETGSGGSGRGWVRWAMGRDGIEIWIEIGIEIGIEFGIEIERTT